MLYLNKENRKHVSAFFKDYTWNYLPDAILEGYTGEVLVDKKIDPSFAVLELPRLKLYIPGGDANQPAARDFIAERSKFAAFIFVSREWESLFKEIHAGRIAEIQRYAFTSEALNIEHLTRFADLVPDEYNLQQMDLRLTKKLVAEKSEFTAEHLVNFESPEDFIANGFGYCILDGEKIISVATTFIVCSKGIEIQINTRENYQRQGLATAIAARLIRHSLHKGLDPNWDAANQSSARLAEKLGYTPQESYNMWFLLPRNSLG